jgi:hypothetical protein
MEQRLLRTNQKPKNQKVSVAASTNTCKKKQVPKKNHQQEPKSKDPAATSGNATSSANKANNKCGVHPQQKKRPSFQTETNFY